MPQLGYGVFQVSPEECERCVTDAIATGYRPQRIFYHYQGVDFQIWLRKSEGI